LRTALELPNQRLHLSGASWAAPYRQVIPSAVYGA